MAQYPLKKKRIISSALTCLRLHRLDFLQVRRFLRNKIDLFSISDAMLLGGQTRQKLQWIYGKSSMPNKLTVIVFLRIHEFKPNVKNIDLLWGEELHL